MFTSFREYLSEHERSSLTILGYTHDLELFARWFEQSNGKTLSPTELTPSDAREYRQYLQTVENAKPATINRRMAALRAYATWAKDSGLVEQNSLSGIRGVGQQPLAPKWLERKQQMAVERELERRMQNARSREARYLAVRNRAIVILLMNTGLRISELCSLNWNDITLTERKGELVVRSGKGSKSRTLPINNSARAVLKEWQGLRGETVSGSVFTSTDSDPLSRRTIQFMLTELGRIAGVDLTPHVLRHTFAKNLVDGGISLEKVAALLGHSNLNTTRVYTTPGIQDLDKAVRILDH